MIGLHRAVLVFGALWNPDFLPLQKPRRRVQGKQRVSQSLAPPEPPRAVVERTRDDFAWDPGDSCYIPDLTTTQIRRKKKPFAAQL